MKKILLLLLVALCCNSIFAQDNIISDTKLLKQHLQKGKYEIDTNAKAIILFEKATAIMREGIIIYEYEKAAKILSKDVASSLSEISIPKFSNTTLRKIKGVCYNINNNSITEQTVEKGEMLVDKVTDGVNVVKFNIPNVKEGSIIHFSYTSEAPFWISIPEWSFQNNYPTLFSRYEVIIPSYIVFNPLERINVPLKYVEKESQLYSGDANTYAGAYNTREKFQIWIRKNVPAFEKEIMMSSSKNVIERVKFQVNAVDNQRKYFSLYNNWKDFSKSYYYDVTDRCGQVFDNNSFLKEVVQDLVKDQNTDLDKAKKIYTYVRANFESKLSAPGSIASGNIKEIFRKKEGSPQGINLLLSAMLIKAGLNSDPVLLSTKENEKLNPIVPEPQNVNHLISRLIIEDKPYYLDASDKNISFAMLRPNCYNGYCRVVNKIGGELELEPNMALNKSVTLVKLEPSEGSRKMNLSVDRQFGAFSSYDYRKEWEKDNEAIKNMLTKEIQSLNQMGTLKNHTVKNLDNPDLPLSIHYEVEFEIDTLVASIYLDPYFSKFYNQNPFPLKNRNYNVEFDYKEDLTYILNFKIPDGFKIDDLPESKSIKYGEKDTMSIKNIINYDETNKSFFLSSRFITNTTSFNASEYNNIRSFYDNLIAEQNKKIVLKTVN